MVSCTTSVSFSYRWGNFELYTALLTVNISCRFLWPISLIITVWRKAFFLGFLLLFCFRRLTNEYYNWSIQRKINAREEIVKKKKDLLEKVKETETFKVDFFFLSFLLEFSFYFRIWKSLFTFTIISFSILWEVLAKEKG